MSKPAAWQEDILERVRALIAEADPDAVETRKWKKPSNPAGVPVWEDGGIICTGETYKDKVKLTFANGAKIDDPTGMLDPGNGKTRAALDIPAGEMPDAEAFKALVRAAVRFNRGE